VGLKTKTIGYKHNLESNQIIMQLTLGRVHYSDMSFPCTTSPLPILSQTIGFLVTIMLGGDS